MRSVGGWRARSALAALLLGGAVAGCTRFTQHAPAGGSEPAAIGHPFDHVVIVVLENANYGDVMKVPYFATLATRGRLLANYHALAHPSYPNYLALITGRRVQTSGDRVMVVNAPSIADPLEAHGLRWAQYADAMPAPCFPRDTGEYRRKHVPFMSIASVIHSPARCTSHVLPATAFDPTNLPAYAFYSPDMKNDGHDTGLRYAAAWLQRFLDPLLVPGRLPPRTVVVVTFDESGGNVVTDSKNHIYTVLLGPAVQTGPADTTYHDHFDLLRTVEDDFGLTPLANGDSAARPISGVWAP